MDATASVARLQLGDGRSFRAFELHDVNCGLKAYRAEVLRGIRLYGELHRFIPVLAAYRGFRVAEIPVHHRPRQHGRRDMGSIATCAASSTSSPSPSWAATATAHSTSSVASDC